MENLKRYGPCLSKSGFATMQRIDNGGWVKFSDIKEARPTCAQQPQAKIARLLKRGLLHLRMERYGIALSYLKEAEQLSAMR